MKQNITSHIPISICIITKNECSTLKTCLEHLFPIAQKYNHEIVVVDTGSQDNTVHMCTAYTTSIYHFSWINDFSAARNFAAKQAKHDWILCIDSDEFLIQWDEPLIQHALNANSHALGGIRIYDTCGNGANQYQSTSILYRMYNKNFYLFTRAIHEQLVPISSNQQTLTFTVPVEIEHKSYAGSPSQLATKAHRNIDLLKKELAQNPHDSYILFQLGQSYYMIEDYQTAYEYYSLGLSEDVNPHLSYVQTMIVSYGYTLLNLKKYQKALELEGIYDTFSSRADFVFLIGMIYMNNGFFLDAIEQFKKATTLTDTEVVGANSFRAWHNIGVIYEVLGNIETAAYYYKKCGNFLPAQARLHELNKNKGSE